MIEQLVAEGDTVCRYVREGYSMIEQLHVL